MGEGRIERSKGGGEGAERETEMEKGKGREERRGKEGSCTSAQGTQSEDDEWWRG